MPFFDTLDDILKVAGRSFGALKSIDDLAGFLSPDEEKTDSTPDATGDSSDPSEFPNGNEGSQP